MKRLKRIGGEGLTAQGLIDFYNINPVLIDFARVIIVEKCF